MGLGLLGIGHRFPYCRLELLSFAHNKQIFFHRSYSYIKESTYEFVLLQN